jgi:hypothetical protein
MIQRKMEEFDRMTIAQKTEVMNQLATYPAMSVMVFLRRDIGLRFLHPRIGVITLVLMVSCAFISSRYKPSHLFFFALFALVIGLGQRIKRWREFRRGTTQHSYYIGTSSFNARWHPQFISRYRLIERIFDPLILFLIALIFWPFTPALGIWIAISGFCLLALEAQVEKFQVDRRMDMVDGLVDSAVQGRTVEQFSPPANPAPHQQPSATLPTGLGADISGRVKRRKIKSRLFFWR